MLDKFMNKYEVTNGVIWWDMVYKGTKGLILVYKRVDYAVFRRI